jgi:membrane-bound lytic murein transglycosylase D
VRKQVLLLLAALFLLASAGHAETDALQRKNQTPDKRIADLEREVSTLKRDLGFYRIPALPVVLTLCGKSIPLGNEDVRERFEREFFQMLENRGLLTILVKRYAKYQAIISEEISKAGLPPDLIYLAVTESYLNPRSVSKANAGGMWQFIKETGKREGLSLNDSIDERFSIVRSTRSALGYLKKGYEEFGDWLLAMAAYNCGEGRIREVLSNQGTRDFFELYLPEETERYILRIAATKEIISNAPKYGLNVEQKDQYKPFLIQEFTIEVKRDVHTSTLAQSMDLSYRTFRELNLHLRKYVLPKGTYYLYVPSEKKDLFLRRIKENSSVTIQSRDKTGHGDNSSG